MVKPNFLSWDTTANNNEDVGGVNIKEGCAPSGINNAIREIMAQLRADIDGGMVYTAKATNYTAVANDNNGYLRFTAAATLSLTAVATLGADWHVFVQADGGDVIVDPNASETINGASTITIRNGESALIISNGSAFFARINSITTVTYAEKAANYTAVAADNGGTLRFTAGATLALTAAATLGSAWRTTVINSSTGLVIVDPNAAETVNGAASVIIGPGQTALIVCSGTAFFADIRGDTFAGPQIQGYASGLALTTNAGDATNDIDFAAGVAASDTSPYNLMQFSALTKRLDATFTAGNNGGMLDTGAVGNGTYYLFGIGRSDTGGTDYLGSLSSSAPTMPANYDRKRRIGVVVRAAAANGPPYLDMSTGGVKPDAVVTLSGTSQDITGIPAGVRRLTIILDEVTVSAAAQLFIQLGTSAGVVTSGYLATAGATSSGGAQGSTATTFVPISYALTAMVGPHRGHIWLTRLGGTGRWQITLMAQGASGILNYAATGVTLPGTLDRIRFGTAPGTATLGGNVEFLREMDT